MTKQPLQTLKGFRDIFPEQKNKRDYVTQKMIEVFKQFAFQPLETPTLEYASLLLGKYGEEADKLVYTFKDQGGRKIGLRYDQTVPTARILGQYRNNMPKFFRRYQIQNVFRADKPQAGRYREFTQCDVDIFGTNSPLADAEILTCTWQAYKNVGFNEVKLRLNDRQLLFEILKEFANDQVSVLSIIQSIDKLDKKSEAEVVQELDDKGLTQDQAQQALKSVQSANPTQNLQEIIDSAIELGVNQADLVFDPTLARGLDYYTGMIFEIQIPQYEVGSCGGGGRYDKLIGELGGMDIPAVGVAFGFDRTVEAADQLNLIPDFNASAQVLVTFFSQETASNSLATAAKLRQASIQTELYPKPNDNLGKQLKLANQKNIPWVIIIGEDEVKQSKVALKNMRSGEQQALSLAAAIEQIQS